MSLLKKMVTLSVYSLIIILIFNFLLKLNPSLSLSLSLGDHRTNYQERDIILRTTTDKIDIDSLERHLRNESESGARYAHIPLQNTRQIRIKNLYRLNEPERTNKMKYYKMIIDRKAPVYEDKVRVHKLESALLSRGLWAICDWEVGMPPPFDKDRQCTETELKYLLENSEDLMTPLAPTHAPLAPTNEPQKYDHPN